MTRQEEVNSLINAFGVKKSFLAGKLGVSRQVLSYQLNVADDLDHDYYAQIMAILDSMKNGSNPAQTTDSRNLYTLDDASAYKHPEQRFKIEAVVPAGLGEITSYDDWFESDVLDYNPKDHAFLRIDEECGHSMMPLVAPGDLVLFSFSAKPKNGDMVVARWDETKGALKIYQEVPHDPGSVLLLSYNQATPVIHLQKRHVLIYKVVLLKKQR